jgi:hypothetical protein
MPDGFGFVVRFGIRDVKTNAILAQTALHADFALPFAENEV